MCCHLMPPDAIAFSLGGAHNAPLAGFGKGTPGTENGHKERREKDGWKGKKGRYHTGTSLFSLLASGGSGTFSLGGGQWGTMVLGWGHSVGTITGFLLRTILCNYLVLMPRVKLVEKYTKHAC